MAGDFRIDELWVQRSEAFERTFLVDLDQARITRDVGRKDRCEPAFDVSCHFGVHCPSTVEDTLAQWARARIKQDPAGMHRASYRKSP